jgi:hypothetical protein
LAFSRARFEQDLHSALKVETFLDRVIGLE